MVASTPVMIVDPDAHPYLSMHAPMADYLNGRWRRGEIAYRTGRDWLTYMRPIVEAFGDRPLNELDRAQLLRWMEMHQHLAPSTRRLRLVCLRMFIRWMHAERLISYDPTVGLTLPRVPRTAPRRLGDDEIVKLRAVLTDSRTKVIVSLMVDIGLRRIEVHNLRITDWDRNACLLHVTGKGGHTRVVPVPTHTTQLLDRYLTERPATEGYLIRQLANDRRVSAHYLGTMIIGQMRKAGIKVAGRDGRTCHALRHTLAARVAEVEPDLRILQQILGHQGLESTQIYLPYVEMPRLRAALEATSDRHTPDNPDASSDPFGAPVTWANA